MAHSDKLTGKKHDKKKARKNIAIKLTKALGDLEKAMGKKKFHSSIKKASHLFDVVPEKKPKKKAKKKIKKAVVKAVPAGPAV